MFWWLMLIKYSTKRPGIERGDDVKGQFGFSDNQTNRPSRSGNDFQELGTPFRHDV